MSPVVRIERQFAAPPALMYRAWLDPELLRRWMAPGDLVVTGVEVDERVGGRYRVWQSVDGIDGGGFDCELAELVPDERIVWRWGFVGPQRGEGERFDSRLTVTLRPADSGGTHLTLVHERLEDLAAALPQVADNVAVGWKSALDKLTEITGAGA